ncbi:MAG: FecR family protein [Planctomycetota bacterium]
MKRVDELTWKLLDDTIDDDEIDELAELTQGSEGRQSLLQMMELESHLHASGHASIADRVVGRVLSERRQRVEEGVMRAVRESRTSVWKPAEAAGNNSSSQLALVVTLIAALAACLSLVIFAIDPSEHERRAIAQVVSHGSEVRILDADDEVLSVVSLKEPVAVRSSETIETRQAFDIAEIVYADGTKLELVGATKIRLSARPDGSKQITILSGLVQADVAPQPEGKPLQIVTQAATLEVLGTTLGVEVRPASTQLGVATGRVAMTRKADGQRVEVAAGRFATATESTHEPLRSHPFPKLSQGWREDFENGLPAGWQTGKLVAFENATAVQAIRSKRSDGERFVITSHNAWQEGEHALCKIDRNSVLHLRIQQRAFARITIMIGARSYPPARGRVGGNLFYTKQAWNKDLPPGTWKTIAIPLKEVAWQMKQAKRVVGSSDLAGIAAYLIHISTEQQDAGLTIERMWITNEVKASQL